MWAMLIDEPFLISFWGVAVGNRPQNKISLKLHTAEEAVTETNIYVSMSFYYLIYPLKVFLCIFARLHQIHSCRSDLKK